MTQNLFDAMAQSIIDGDSDRAADLARQSIARGIDPMAAINEGFMPGVKHVGEEFSCGRAFIPELVIAGAAMKGAMGVLEPEIARQSASRQSLGKVVLATVEGDIHDIGKNLVGTMLSAYGFEVHDLGVNVPAENIVGKAREVGADIVALSALLTITMANQQDVVRALEDGGLRESVRVLVGGAAVTRDWAEQIGADGYGEDAIDAVEAAKALLGKA